MGKCALTRTNELDRRVERATPWYNDPLQLRAHTLQVLLTDLAEKSGGQLGATMEKDPPRLGRQRVGGGAYRKVLELVDRRCDSPISGSREQLETELGDLLRAEVLRLPECDNEWLELVVRGPYEPREIMEAVWHRAKISKTFERKIGQLAIMERDGETAVEGKWELEWGGSGPSNVYTRRRMLANTSETALTTLLLWYLKSVKSDEDKGQDTMMRQWVRQIGNRYQLHAVGWPRLDQKWAGEWGPLVTALKGPLHDVENPLDLPKTVSDRILRGLGVCPLYGFIQDEEEKGPHFVMRVIRLRKIMLGRTNPEALMLDFEGIRTMFPTNGWTITTGDEGGLCVKRTGGGITRSEFKISWEHVSGLIDQVETEGWRFYAKRQSGLPGVVPDILWGGVDDGKNSSNDKHDGGSPDAKRRRHDSTKGDGSSGEKEAVGTKGSAAKSTGGDSSLGGKVEVTRSDLKGDSSEENGQCDSAAQKENTILTGPVTGLTRSFNDPDVRDWLEQVHARFLGGARDAGLSSPKAREAARKWLEEYKEKCRRESGVRDE